MLNSPIKIRPWDPVNHLKTPEDIAAYLDAAFEDGDAALIMAVLNDVARTKFVTNFCQRWHIRNLALFGSALRDDFHADSDLDLLVTFDDDAAWSLFDHVQMEWALSALVESEIDLVSRWTADQRSLTKVELYQFAVRPTQKFQHPQNILQ